jgi:tRNA (guanine37-N1)-methyltransferase
VLRIDILSLFPEVFEPVLGSSICGRARQSGLVEWHATNIRDFADNKHNKVDDRPFGGGPGMVMMCQPVWDAVHHVEAQDSAPATRILLTPQGRPMTQELARELSAQQRLLFICGHYEGIDERVVAKLEPLEISLGDFVCSGGEIPAMAVIDAVVRLLPGALGHEDSAGQDSFEIVDSSSDQRLLDCPHYTRPREWMGMEVPNVLLSGDHGNVEKWRLERSRERTRARRPDMLPDP